MASYFYGRVSSASQNLQRQIDKAHELGFADDHIFLDQGLTGRNTNRPQLQALLSVLESGDSVTCTELARLSRSTRDLLRLSDQFQALGVDLVSLKENIDSSTPMGRFFFTVTSAFNQLELELSAERAREGREAAKAQGRTGGRPRVDPESLERAVTLAMETKLCLRDIVIATGVSRNVIYTELRKRGLTRGHRKANPQEPQD